MAESLKPDHHLLESFRKTRSEENFRSLYRKYTPVLYRVAFRFLGGNPANAEEVVQEAWVRTVENLDRFKGGSSFRTWLTGILINCCREFRRQRMKSQKHPGKEALDEAGPAEVLHRKMDLEAILQNLSDGYREILVLHDIEGFTHREIAELLNISEGTSKSQLSRARSVVRKWLAADNKRQNEVNNEQ